MSLFNIYDIAGSGMVAQNVRLNTTASNMANASTLAGAEDAVYQEKQPVFQSVLIEQNQSMPSNNEAGFGVRVVEIAEVPKQGIAKYDPGHPLSDEEGYVYMPDINMVEQMTNMISASRSYQSNVDLLDTVTKLMTRTLSMGQ